MINKNGNNSSCAFNEQIVSYLYDEAEPQEKFKFESHLKNCAHCADELAGFESVRSSVLDWRAEDFSILETPTFDVSVIKSAKHISPASISNQTLFWIGEIKNIFSFNPKLAMAAFAVLIVFTATAVLTLKFSGSNETAQNENDKNITRAAVSPTIEISTNSEEEKSSSKDDKKSSASRDTNLPQTTREIRVTTENKTAVKVSDVVAPKINTDISTRSPKIVDDNIRKTPPVRKQKAPRLNDEEEDEDKTIRLADLFDELDTK